METVINVGIGDIKIARSPNLLVARGLGSCIAASMYDPLLRLGGMAHILLPESAIFERTENPYKFANMAIPALVTALCRESGNPKRFEVKLAGGARMFSFSSSRKERDIGAQNVERIARILEDMGLLVAAQDLGGRRGRTVSLHTNTGALVVRVFGSEPVVI